MPKEKNSRLKNPEQYEALKDKGYSKTKAARIANTLESKMEEGRGVEYESRTKKELYEKAKKVGINGRSKMNKEELIHALRNN